MRRLVLMTGAAVGLAFAAVAGAQGSQTIYEGGFDGEPQSKVRVKVLEAEDGKLFVTSLAARRVDVTCEGGVTARIKKVVGRGRVRVGSHGAFRFANDDGDTLLKFSGEIGPPPAGKFRFSGKIDTGAAGRLQCDSGRLFWTSK